MKILVLNQDWFVEDFRALGHEVVTAGTRNHLDYVIQFPVEDINHLLSRIGNNFYPDFVLVLDESTALTVSGLEELKVPICFYSVDTHHHHEVHSLLLQAFDFAYVAHKDYLKMVQNDFCDTKWLPLYASRYLEPVDEKEYGAVFVGTLNPKLNEDRVHFFNELQKKVPVLVTSGDFASIFPKSEIIINQTVKGDLNFRVFEAMMSGAMLLTESSSNGLFDLFQDGVHLVTYKKNDVEDAASKIRYYLEHKDEAKKIAQTGRQAILELHTSKQRAETILSDFEKAKKNNNPMKYFAFIANFVWASNLIQKKSQIDSIHFLEQAIKCIDKGYKTGINPPDNVVPYIIVACTEIDHFMNTDIGYHYLQLFTERKFNVFFPIAMLWNSIHLGKKEEAASLLGKYFSEINPEFVIKKAEDAMGEILRGSVLASSKNNA